MPKTKKQNPFQCFYDILEETLKGRRVKLRSYEHSNDGLGNDFDCFTHKPIYKTGKNGKRFEFDNEVIGWNDKLPYNEWTGTVDSVLQNDNSHVDIIFDRKKPMSKLTTVPGDTKRDLLDDCFNWHMGDYIEFLD